MFACKNDKKSLIVLCDIAYHMGMTNILCRIETVLKRWWWNEETEFTGYPIALTSTFQKTEGPSATAPSPSPKHLILTVQKMAPGVSSCLCRDNPPSISFSGCGFMATYQVGVAQCLLNYAPWILRTAPCVLGASAGSLVAAAVVCEINLGEWLLLPSLLFIAASYSLFCFTVSMRDEMLHFAKQMKTFTLGPFNPSINVLHWLEFILHKHLPSNAHQLATGRLAVAVTRMTDRKPVIMSDFGSKEDVVQVSWLVCYYYIIIFFNNWVGFKHALLPLCLTCLWPCCP